MSSAALVLYGLVLAFASFAAYKERTLASISCFVTALVLFLLGVLR